MELNKNKRIFKSFWSLKFIKIPEWDMFYLPEITGNFLK